MTNEQINVKIAEACGWKRVPEPLGHGLWFCPLEPGIKLRGIRSSCPDYCNDLDAMHDAVQTLNTVQQVQMVRRLSCLGVCWGLTATARQRAEAFLRTLNLWEK